MKKYRVIYYKDHKPIEKEVEATRFEIMQKGSEGGPMLVKFLEGIGGNREVVSAFSNVISVEKID